jgi:hypothetical protein
MRRISSFRHLLYMVILFVFAMPSLAQVRISVSFGPPALPVYEQPLCPGESYMWVPGYWAWDDDYDDYYWVPGTWVLAPEPGLLWTPPYWAWDDGAYLFHEGYWAPQVGFYGGIVYGFGYFGVGFVGGRWEGDRFFYNRAVTNVNVVNIRNVYHETVNVRTENRVSFNGGPGGVQARPRPQDEAIARGRRLPPVAAQTQHYREARSNRELRASDNHGRPPVAATARPGEFRNATPAREAGAPYNPPANRGREASRSENNGARPAVHPRDLPPIQRPSTPNTGQSNRDQKYQQQQDKLFARQQQDRQKLQQKQEQEDQRLQRQNADQARKQQTEQRHQQQTQQLQQRHGQEQQRMQEKQQPPHKK